MFDINLTLVIFVASFLLFMMALNALFLKPVGEAIEKRSRMITGDHEAAKSNRDQARLKLENYEARVAEIRKEAQAEITEAVTQAQKVRAKALSDLKDKGRVRLDAAREELKQERAQLMNGLVAEESKLVEQIVGKLVGDAARVNLDASAVKKALEEAV